MTEYKILQDQSTVELQSQVQNYIKCSWLPIGGVSVHVDKIYVGDGQFQHYTHYTQAIIKSSILNKEEELFDTNKPSKYY